MTTPRPTLALPDELPADPMPLLDQWLRFAHREYKGPNPACMALATVDKEDPQPSVRMVLCRDLVTKPGYLVFYTNYSSLKARELEANPHGAAAFHWDELGLQVRVRGPVRKSPARESDEYFAGRHPDSQLGAWASRQSEPIASRAVLLGQLQEVVERFQRSPGIETGPAIPRPTDWGGYRLWAAAIEFWVSSAGRLHDRALWRRTLTSTAGGDFDPGPWSRTRLQP